MVSTLVDFIARERAMQTMELRDTKPALALAVHRRALVRRIGLLTTRSWAHTSLIAVVAMRV